jgi:2-amino-4-hydroxy-6-hydroxymethyldihydropteridine diphosphokinase
MEIGLSLGANLGDRLATLCAARDRLAALPGVRLVAQAPLYETEPVGVKPAYRRLKFLNTVLILETMDPPAAVQQGVAAVEQALGRVRTDDRFAPRTIDIDMLYAGGDVSETERLTLPHPRWARRRFVVQPLADVRPDLVLPGQRRTVAEILSALPPGESVALWARTW